MRRMRISDAIAEGMVFAMIRHPIEARPFACQCADPGNKIPHNWIRRKAAMRQHAVVAQANANAASEPMQTDQQDQTRPGEIPRCCQRTQMNGAEPSQHNPRKTISRDVLMMLSA